MGRLRRGTLGGSLTKEFPIASIDRTIGAILPGMPFTYLQRFANENTNRSIPAILKNRFLLISNGRVVHDVLLSIANAEGLATARVRKLMYFVWACRDERIRRFVCERIANRQGLWRPAEVTRKANAAFFAQFVGEDSAPKARSNYQRFLAETRIFDEATNTVHLELDDNWLFDAVRVAAQHERDEASQHAMLTAPVEFLVSRNLNGLANATAESLRRIATTSVPLANPFEDETVATPTIEGRPWNREPPAPALRRTARIVTDQVAQERANVAHFQLERTMAVAVRAMDRIPLFNENIDMYFLADEVAVLAEMKSCYTKNLRSQVRRGVSQLLEYQYVYRDILGRNVAMLLLLEIEPSLHHAWLIDFALTLNIVIAWKQANRIVTTAPIPPSLFGLVHNAA